MDLKLRFKGVSEIMSTNENSHSFSGRKKVLHSLIALLLILSAGSSVFAVSPVKASVDNHQYLAQNSDSDSESDEYVPESGNNEDYGNDSTDTNDNNGEVPGDTEPGDDEGK